MLSRIDFIRQSLETHLFFARIMKEHSFFLEIGFTPRDDKYTHRANELKAAFTELLAETIALSDGVVSPDLLESGEVVTQYTYDAERLTEFYTGVTLDTHLTESEVGLGYGADQFEYSLERSVALLNNKALKLLNSIIQFKSNVLENMLACRMFTMNYPLLIDHILREAHFYHHLIRRLQSREEINTRREAYEQEFFWNRIMAEHAKFIRGLLDPSEDELIQAANNFGNQFDALTAEAKAAMDLGRGVQNNVTEESLRATKEIRQFKAQGTEGILNCKVKSIIIPLLGDHTLREANHFLRLLKIFNRVS